MNPTPLRFAAIGVMACLFCPELRALDGTVTVHNKGDTKASYGFMEYLPAGYAKPKTKAGWPLVVFLHGSGCLLYTSDAADDM
jgi:predicted peptidase